MFRCWCSKADLVVCRGLQHLDVSSNQLQAATCAALGHVISTSCQLQHLRLDLNPLGKQVTMCDDSVYCVVAENDT